MQRHLHVHYVPAVRLLLSYSCLYAAWCGNFLLHLLWREVSKRAELLY